MAVINCKQCDLEVSKKAKICPMCGVKRPGSKLTKGRILLAVFGIVIGALLFTDAITRVNQ